MILLPLWSGVDFLDPWRGKRAGTNSGRSEVRQNSRPSLHWVDGVRPTPSRTL